MEDDFYLPPGSTFEPGDIFAHIPFPVLKHPLEFFRPSPKQRNSATLFKPGETAPKDGDTARGPFTARTVILLSHGCELDAVVRDVEAKQTEYDRRYWLVAPVRRLSDCGSKVRERTLKGQQPNRFLLREGGPLGNEPFYADLRQITPITVPYFFDGQKVCSLTDAAKLALQAHIGLFFSGLVLYVQPIDCPACGEPIDPKLFVVPSTDEDSD